MHLYILIPSGTMYGIGTSSKLGGPCFLLRWFCLKKTTTCIVQLFKVSRQEDPYSIRVRQHVRLCGSFVSHSLLHAKSTQAARPRYW